MPLGSFVKKPNINYSPEKVLTPEPVRKLDGVVDFADAIDTSSKDLEVVDIINQLKDEDQKLQDIQDAILSTVPNVDILVPEEYADVVGKTTLSTSEYTSHLDGTEYGSVVIAELIESHYLSATNPAPQFLLLSSLHGMSSTIKQSIEALEGDMFSGFYDDPDKREGLQVDAVSGLLNIPRQDIKNSKNLRYEVLRTVSAIQQEISECVIHNILNSGNGDDSSNTTARAQMTKRLQALKSMRSLLKYYTTVYATDWKSGASFMRTQISSRIMSEMLYFALNTYQKAEYKLLQPVMRYYRNMTAKTTCPMWDSFNDMVLNSVMDVGNRGSEVLADIFDYKEDQAKLQLDKTRKSKALMITKKWLPMLDAVILVMEQLVTESKSINPKDVNKILSAARSGDKIADSSKQISSKLDGQLKEMGIDPDYPDPKGLAPPGMGNLGPEAMAEAARDYLDYRRSTESSEDHV